MYSSKQLDGREFMFIRIGALHEVLDLLLITVTTVLCDAHRHGNITLYPASAYSYLSIRNKIKP